MTGGMANASGHTGAGEYSLVENMMASVALLFFVCAVLSRTSVAADQPRLDTRDDRINYSIGYQVGGDIRRQQLQARPDSLLKGIRDAVNGDRPELTQAEMSATLAALSQRLEVKRQQQQRRIATENLAKGEAFLLENAGRSGVVTTASGLQYKIISQGTGDSPGRRDRVRVHYTGRLIDGTEFDRSADPKAAAFALDQVIAGWSEALRMMREGARWRLYIPPQLAYGDRRVGAIPPNSVLVYDIELVDVSPAGAGRQAGGASTDD